MHLVKGTTEWPAIDPKTQGTWLWNRGQDLFWIAGGGSLLFALLAVPVTLSIAATANLLVVGFLHAAALCNLPHYAVTYQLIWRERAKAPSSYRWLLASAPLVVALVVAGAIVPALIHPLVRFYLTWSVYHYAAQHFGIASMYQARDKRALDPREKRALQVGFVAVGLHLMLLINTYQGLGTDDMLGVASGLKDDLSLIPLSWYPLSAACAIFGVGAYALGEVWHKRRTGGGLGLPARLLFLTNFIWFVVPFVHLPGRSEPWTGNTIATWVPFALPFFHCAQYLGVCGWRARTTGAIKPALYFMALVFLGLALFEGTTYMMPFVSKLDRAQALMLVPAVLNLHHFFLDGLMWKARRRPAAASPAVAAPAAPAEQKAA